MLQRVVPRTRDVGGPAHRTVRPQGGGGGALAVFEDPRTSPTVRLQATRAPAAGAAGATGAAGVEEPQRPSSPAASPDGLRGLRPGEEGLLLALARLAKAVLPATSGTCLTLHESTRTARTLSDTALGQAVDRAQRQAAAGPSLTAHRDGEPCCSTDLREDPRWRGLGALLPPSSAPRAAGAVHRSRPISAVSLPLSDGALVLGVLTLYGDGHPLLVDEEDVAHLVTVGVVASQMLALLSRARRAEEGDPGPQAARTGGDPGTASAVVPSLSQDRHTDVHDRAAAPVRSSGDDGLDAPLRATAELSGLLAR